MRQKKFFTKTIYKPSTQSTNTYFKTHDFPDKTVLYTFNQSQGRGRGEKSWMNFKNKNLALSFLLKPEDLQFDTLWYIAACSLSLTDLLEEINISNSWIKWPNDIYIGYNKIAGVLAESVWTACKIDKIIVGIGININTTNQDLAFLDNKATSFFIESGKSFDLDTFTDNYINRLGYWLDVLINERDLEKIRSYWLSKSKIINREVEWKLVDVCKTGIVKDIELDGTLILETVDGQEKVTAGDISLIDPFK